MPVGFPVEDLLAFAYSVFCRLGIPRNDAHVAARRMLEADLRGMSGHGIFRLPQYAARLEAGGYTLRPKIQIVRETPVSALIDGDNGLGQVVVTRAVEVAIAKARAHGLAWVGVRGSNHAGAGGVYASMALEHRLVGVYLAVGSANHIPPWGGLDPLLSTNPLAVAIPAGEEQPVVLDMATTVVSYGRIKIAADRGETLPVGWMVDHNGSPLTDPNRRSEGYLVPIGAYKGYGLGMTIGMLAGVLNGAAFGSSVVDFTTDHRTPANTGQAVLVVRPDLFRPLDEFCAEMDKRIREFRRSRPVPGGPPVRVPGDQAAVRAGTAGRDGIVLGVRTIHQLQRIAERLGLSSDLFGETST